jgi:hypothetical protein
LRSEREEENLEVLLAISFELVERPRPNLSQDLQAEVISC